ncbi:FUSC family protein [Streptomyces arenae]|uniref:FUSC family protein n=1 Tax=Streptomyces arenae TaxID=29301 RepID=UPI002658E6B4|nr:FUSC family protein [Streptomyces arenae]MCG7205140.1 FUSC family protein [Streptomyces arenae]
MEARTPLRSVRDAGRTVTGLYLAREGHWAWRFGVGMVLALGVPLAIGIAAGRPASGVAAGIGSYLLNLLVPQGDLRNRVRQIGLQWLACSAATALGVLVSGSLPLTVLAIALIAPVATPGMAPVIPLVFAVQGLAGAGGGTYALLFASGGLWTSLLLFIPLIVGRPDSTPPTPHEPRRGPEGRGRARHWAGVRASVTSRTPEFRHKVRLAVCFTLAFIAVGQLHIPHGTWVLAGVFGCLRPTWGQTTSRMAKRVIGNVLGSSFAAALLILAPAPSAPALAAVTVACAGTARILRGYNYGLWPIFAAPAMLLLFSLDARSTWIDAAERVSNNMAGAALAALATLFLWPHREQTLVPGRLENLLMAQARYLDRVASLAAGPPPAERAHTRDAVEAAEQHLETSKNRLATQPRPPRQLIAALDAVRDASARLRAPLTAHPPHATPPLPYTPDALHHLAQHLRDTGATLDSLAAPRPAPPELQPPGTSTDITNAAHDLMRHATRAATLAIKPAPRDHLAPDARAPTGIRRPTQPR